MSANECPRLGRVLRLRAVGVPTGAPGIQARLGLGVVHTAGHRGRGVRVAVVDAANARREPMAHARAMVALVGVVAPEATIRTFPLDPADPVGSLARGAANADLVLCAWSVPPDDTLDDLARGLPGLLAVADRDARSPARGAVAVMGLQTAWPRGPFRLEGVPRAVSGRSVAAALVMGGAALLVAGGIGPDVGLTRLLSASPSILRELLGVTA